MSTVGHVAAVTKDAVQLLRVAAGEGGVVQTKEVGRYAMGANTAEGFVWSADGAMFAVINKELGVEVYSFPELEKLCSVAALSRGIKNVTISPKNNFLIVAESAVMLTKAHANTSKENAALYHIPSKDKKLGNLRVRKLTEPFWPAMRWTEDEKICFRVLEFQDVPTNAIMHSYDGTSVALAANSAVLHLMNTKSQETLLLPVPGLMALATSPGRDGRVCCFFGRGDELRGRDVSARVEIFDLGAAARQRPFRAELQEPADSATIAWNSAADKILLSATVEVDETGRTYYGRSTLYVLTSISSSAWVLTRPAAEVGLPLHDARWSPGDSAVFAAVAGAMPGNAGLFKVELDGRVTQLRTLGVGLPRNTLRFSPSGRFLAVGGFGALPGDIDFWDLTEKRCLKTFRAPCTVESIWAPSGARLYGVCTTSPRMRVDNAISMYNYDGTKLLELPFPVLYAAAWRPVADVIDQPSSPRVLATATELPGAKTEARKAYKAPGVMGGSAFAAAFAAEDDRRKRRTYERTANVNAAAKPSKWDKFPDRSTAVTPEDVVKDRPVLVAEPATVVATTAATVAPAAAADLAATVVVAAPTVAAPTMVAATAVCLRPLPVKEWYYRDLEGVVQGPFGLKSMQSWSTQGYFAPDLEMRVGGEETRRFVAMRLLFPEPLTPFKDQMVWPWN